MGSIKRNSQNAQKYLRQTISLIEREEFVPSLLIAKRIAHIFNETIESIFIFDEEEL